MGIPDEFVRPEKIDEGKTPGWGKYLTFGNCSVVG
jgi:hypothetical protein